MPDFSSDFFKFRRCGANIGNLHHGLLEAKILMDPAERADFNRKVTLRKSQITDLYNAAPDKSVLTSEWLSAEMYKLLNPVVVKKQESSSSFFEDFDFFLETRKLSDVRTRNFRVIYRDLQRFELYRRINVSKRFHLSFDSVTPDILREFETFLRQEHPPTWPAAALSVTSTNRSKTRTWSAPSAATKKAAAPSPATAKSTRI